ncbi:hypothetical protein PV327_006394 [Microctonus hyperodae]|uniref:Dynein heavy chain 7, axonemal n=1 Tax=Microctonus hyperodae TaxID=165561 RepID=A0AA39F4B0_MICHY|nr:hypothetical protein PV327_006394 [Microctonus hyperodae]
MEEIIDDNLIKNKCKYPKLSPIPCLELSHVNEFKINSHYKSVQHKPISNTHKDDLENEILFKPKLPKSFYIAKLRDWVEETPIIGLLPEWKNNIKKLIHNSWKHRYNHLQQELFKEVENLYINDMKQLAIQSTVINHDEMENKIKNDFRKRISQIHHKFYRQIVKIISNQKLMQNITSDMMPQFMRCATNLFVQQILYSMMHTINHMINAIKYNKHCLQIELELVIDNGLLTIKPCIDEMKNMYREIIDNIDKIGQNLLSFTVYNSSNCNNKLTDDYICIKLPDWFIKKSQNKLEIIINNLFTPLNNYYENIKAEFNFLCAPETRINILHLITSNCNYDIYYEQVQKYNNYLQRANAIISILYYDVGRLKQTRAKEELKLNITDIIDILVNKLVCHHLEYNETICRDYEAFKSHAFNIPNNAEELFKLNDSMALNSKSIIDNLEEKIKESLRMLITLFNITILTDEHIKLNSKTINCSHSIKDIFIQSNTLCEAMKSELEDELQKKINSLSIEIDDIFPMLIILNDMDDANRVHEYTEYLNYLVVSIEKIDEQIKSINMEEKLFKFPETTFPKIDDIKNIVLPFSSLNNMISKWKRHNAAWLDGPFEYIDAAEVEKFTNFYLNEFTNLNKSIKANIKSDMASHKLFKFSGMIDDPDPMQQPAPMKLCFQALQQINEFKHYVELINCICNKAMEQRHWDEMSIIYGSDITPNAGTTLRKFITLNLMKDIEKYNIISIGANKELALQRQIENMHKQWDDVNFIIEYNKIGRLFFVYFNEIQVHLDEHLTIIQEMMGSYFVKPFMYNVIQYNKSLILIRDIINHFNIIQDECLNLHPIFINNEMCIEELTNVGIIYSQVLNIVDDMKQSILNKSTFEDIGNSPEYLVELLKAMEKIEVIKNDIRIYLNNIRLIFPRFFFLSDKELVTILFEKNVIERVKILLKKCFRGVNNIKVNLHRTNIISIISDYNEELSLKKKFVCNNKNTNEWLKLIEISISESIHNEIYNYINSENITDDKKIISVKHFSLGMISECIIQLIWTSKIHKYFININSDTLKSIFDMQNLLIVNTINNLKNQLIMKDRIILMSLAAMLSHQREVISLLILKNVSHVRDFHWMVQLRYYWQENNIQVEILNDSRCYGYEFLTISKPVINTLLTDRCYRTIVEASRHNLFTTLVGHPATGKTETIKGLTRAFAVPFHIINCCKNLTCDEISKIFKGLIACGTWVCFKNINAIRFGVLSAITHHIYLLSQMISSKSLIISFDGSQLIPKPGGYIITTDNYQHLSKICETQLFAAGFSNAKILANKIQLVFKLCIEQFPFEKRYNFGCKTLNAVIQSAIKFKFDYPSTNENVIVLRSLIDVNLPVFSHCDLIIFQEFLLDIFPGVSLPPTNYTSILTALKQVAKINSVQIHKVFELKIIQILEMIYLRRVFMIIGDASVGKTILLRTLAQCLTAVMKINHDNREEIGADIQLEIINQKSLTLECLFGYFDDQTNKWNEGIYTTLLRSDYNKNNLQNKIKKWIVFDGPVESVLTENLNILLDDNDCRTLPLPTGEIIEISDSMSVILETDNIEEASPGTVSRCGIIYIEQKIVGYKHHIAAWVIEQKFHDKYNKFMNILIEWSLDSCLNFVYKKCQFRIAVERIYLVLSTLKLCRIFIKNATEQIDEKDKNYFEIWCQAAVLQSIIWTFNACLSTDSSLLFNEFCLSLWSNNDINNPRPKDTMQHELLLPCDGMIKDNTYIFKGTGSWKHWNDILKTDYISTAQICGFGLKYVPTIDTIKHIFMFNNHIKYRIPFIVSGDMSIGKTTLMRFFLNNKLSNNEYITTCFNFPPSYYAHQAQHLILQKLNRIMGDCYVPPKNKFGINFIDDLNIISDRNDNKQLESLLELIRQHIDHGYCTPNCESIVKIFSNILLYNLKKNLFTSDVIGSVNNMVNATVEIYTSIINRLKPNPINIQYQFNIRDVSKVIEGCSLIHRESAETKVTLIRLWVHESIRVFGDRITNECDNLWLFSNIKSAIKTHFKETFESIFDHLPKDNNTLTQESLKNLIFTNFMMEIDKDVSNNRHYEEVNSIHLLKNRIINYLNELNNSCDNKLDILLLSDMLEHLIRVCRVLIIPGGNLLMICTGGLGRKSLTRLAAFIERQDFFQCTSTHYCDLNEWRQNLKCVVKICGGIGKQCTFFIPARYIKDNYYEDISSLMTTGEVPQLISSDERQLIVEIARLPAQNGDRNLEISINEVMNYFFNNCQEKLHFILYFNLSNCNNLRRQLQLFPALIKHSFIDYFMPWSLDTFLQFGNKFINDISVGNVPKEKIISAGKYFYDESKKINLNYYKKYLKLTHTTPSAFIHMMKLYGVQMTNKQKTITESRNKYLGGLKKLELAAVEVIQMQETLTALRPQLELSAKKTEETMREIESENVSVENATIQVKRDEEIANKTAKIAASLKCECEADLAVAIPILEDAVAALNTLKPSDITLVKAMKNPPDTVKLVMAAVCVMLDVAAERIIDPVTGRKSMDFWGPSKRVLGDMNFLQNLKDYDKDNIPPAIMQVIKKTYMTDQNFMPQIVTKASSAAEGLCKWVRAMVSYDEVAKIVAPKKEKLAAAEKECNECLAFLNEKRKTLAALNDKLTALKTNLQDTLAKKFKLENEVAICTEKLMKAEALIASLDDEKNKWLQSAELLKQSYDNLPGDILISCGVIAYLAPFNSVSRNNTVKLWIEYVKDYLMIPCSSNYNFVNCLVSEIEINSWYQYGLPKDDFSLENAVILTNSMQLCLFIDPQNQANMWIKKMEKSNGLIIIKLTDSNYFENIVHNIELNQPILIENINDDKSSMISIDCILSYIINNCRNNYSNELHQQIADCNTNKSQSEDSFSYKNQFRLYMITKLENPRFNRYIYSKITVINFLLTEHALKIKLLDVVISREKPELHEKFDLLVDHSASNMRILKQEEDNILTVLSTSNINILYDDKSMKILDTSKNLSVEIMKKEKCANIAKNEINKFRNSYNEFAHYCAVLYSTLLPMFNLNCMYRFSLEWFMHLYMKSIVNSRRNIIIEKRLEYLKNSFTETLHTNVLTNLFDEHRVLYSFLLCLKILTYTGQIELEEIDLFMFDCSNNNDIIKSDIDMNDKPDWLAEKSWEKIVSLSRNTSAFYGLDTSIKNEEMHWLNFYKLENPDDCSFPNPWRESLTPFQKLIIFKIIRSDRIIIEIKRFISTSKKLSSTYSPRSISYFYSESSCLIPLIFILPSYMDPLKQVEEFAVTMGYKSKLKVVSLSDNHIEHVHKIILQAQEEGKWVFLENCHFAKNWLLQLEKIYESFNASKCALEFRLWLSTVPTRLFPINILQNGIKIICDVPSNLKQNLINLYYTYPLNKPEIFTSCPGKDKILAKLIYAFAFFHVLVKERNYFGIQSWNVKYDLCHSDFTISISQLQTLIKNDCVTDTTLFDALLHLIGECNYGGKFIDYIDNKCVMTIFRDYCKMDIISQDNYLFCDNYSIPNRCEYRDYIKHIINLPEHPSRHLFGIDENSMINRDILIVNDFFSQISQLNGQSINDGESFLQDNINVMSIDILLNKLPPAIDIDEAEKKSTELDPLNRVLIQEITAYNLIIKNIKQSLMQPDDEMTRALSANKLPTLWYFFPTFCQHQISLSKFMDNINKKYEFFNKWINGEYPRSFWLGIFASAKRFISVIKIILTRQYKIPADQLVFNFQVLSINDSSMINYSNEKAFYFHDLHLTGASWDIVNGNLIPSNPRILSELMPVIQLTPQFVEEKKLDNFKYSCPLYKSNIARDLINYAGSLSNLIIYILLSTEINDDHWIKLRTALFCQIE